MTRKIALIHHQLAYGGGMETYLLDLITALAERGFELDVFVMKQDPAIVLPAHVSVRVMPVSKLIPRFLRKYVFAYYLSKRLHRDGYQCVISTTRSFSQDLIITGGTHRGYMKTLRRYWPSDFLEAYLENKAYHASRKIIATSPSLAQDLLEYYDFPEEKIVMLYPPVNILQLMSEKTALPFPPREREGKFRLLFPSTSHKRKGGFLLLKAMKLLPPDEFELWVVGKPFQQAKHLPHVRCVGYVKNLADYLRQVDILILPSYFEPFGLVVPQALECGRPVIISSRVGARELVSAEEGLVLEQQDPHALAALIRQAKTYPFKIKPGFVARHHLSLTEHVDALLRETLI